MKWISKTLAAAMTAADTLLPWKWAEQEIDYSRAMNYDTPYRGRFDPELMPFWKHPLEAARDALIREIVILKASRCGYSENYLLTDLRYTMAREPEPTLYVTGKMDLAKGFLDRRVLRGMGLAKELKHKMRAAKVVAQDIQLADMDFRATWSSSDTATKQDGWARIYGDEVSLWPEFTVDMLRRRCAAYPFHHLIFGGSLNPERKGRPDEDPTLKLYEESDKHIWMMRDPKTNQEFTFSLDCIKWPDECKTDDGWDLKRVEAEAYYETANGTRIDEAQRMDVVRGGRWECTEPDGSRRGYKVVALMVPFADCTFGQVAARFLSAKHRMNLTGSKEDRQRNTLRTYFAEMWAEAHMDEEVVARDDSLAARECDYSLGSAYVPTGSDHMIIFTADVQKYHFWWLARVWSQNKRTGAVTSALLDYGNSASMADLDTVAGGIKPNLTGIDIGYALRATEVGAYCSQYTDQDSPENAAVMALRGSDNLKAMPIDHQTRDAYEGGRSAGRALFYELIFQTDVFRTVLIDAINGDAAFDWKVPKDHGDDKRWAQWYVKQVLSTRKSNGEWIVNGKDDHMFDNEVMQLVIAQADGLIQ